MIKAFPNLQILWRHLVPVRTMVSMRHVFVVGTICVASITVVITFTLSQRYLGFETWFYESEIGSKNEDVHVLKMQLERQKQISRFCKMKKQTSFKTPGGNRLRGVLQDKRANVAFVPVPKVACSSWRVFFITRITSDIFIPRGKPHDLSFLRKTGIKMYDLPVENAEERFQHVKTVVFVRHPLARLLSAYTNKMISGPYKWKYVKDIYNVTNYKPARSDGQNKTASHVPFRVFVKYIIARQDHKDAFDVHWRPQISQLYPCQIRYDFIGKLETIQKDTRYIFKIFFHNASLSLPLRNSGSNITNGFKRHKKSSKEYYAELTPKELEDIISVYSDDFEVFGYPRTVPE